jgi:hypothetical protein
VLCHLKKFCHVISLLKQSLLSRKCPLGHGQREEVCWENKKPSIRDQPHDI